MKNFNEPRRTRRSGSLLLRQALLIAAKLGREDFKSWIEKELYGYGDNIDDLPSYRILKGAVKGKSPFQGWLPILIDEPELATKLSKVPIESPVAQIQEMRQSTDLIVGYPAQTAAILRKYIDEDVDVGRHVSGAAVRAILDIVRNEVLSWTIRLEAAGVTGEGYRFTAEEKTSAKSVPMHIYNISAPTNISHVGEVHDSAVVNIDQSAPFTHAQLEELFRLIREIDSHKEQLRLGQEQHAELIVTLDFLVAALSKGNAEPRTIREFLGTLRKIVEGAAGSLLATGILTHLARFG